MHVNLGDIFWVSPNETNQIASDHTHPHVVVQVNAQDTVVLCALTSNLKRAKEPGNVLLYESEAGLLKQSVVMAAQVSTVNRSQLGKHVGTLTKQRLNQVLAGIRFLQYMTQHHAKELTL